ncbi:MAG: hypothetical protein JWP82_1838 [Humibacillus sp.]|nr:hypothetical protein [Humibacillus sp.]
MSARRAWVRRNRVGLVLLPVALVAALAGNAERLQTLWWEDDLRVPQRPDSSGVVHVLDAYDDGHHAWPIRPEVSLVSVVQADTLPGYDGAPTPVILPAGTTLRKVTLHVSADPNMIISGCTLALADADGTRWEARSGALKSEAQEPASPCTPDGRSGPSWLPQEKQPVVDANSVRPATYDVASYVVLPVGAKPTEVWVWWAKPRFAALPIPEPRS